MTKSITEINAVLLVKALRKVGKKSLGDQQRIAWLRRASKLAEKVAKVPEANSARSFYKLLDHVTQPLAKTKPFDTRLRENARLARLVVAAAHERMTRGDHTDDFEMFSMYFEDAADMLSVAHHLNEGRHERAYAVAKGMDTEPSEYIPDEVRAVFDAM